MASINDKIRYLAAELKSHCEHIGWNKYKEKNVLESSKVIHKLGRLYRRYAAKVTGRKQKFYLIRSAALYNAAIIRYPINVQEIEEDLKEVCTYMLELAGAAQSKEDIIERGKMALETINQTRNITEMSLSQAIRSLEDKDYVDFTSKMQNINNQVYKSYKLVMERIMKHCIQIKGPPPCKYALVGMGSLARKEITPYSDFEHIYVLEEGIQKRRDYQQILDYFRWVAVIFQFVIINMGETIIPHMSIPYVNDQETEDWFYDAITPKGVCFDGMVSFASKFPLGFSGNTRKPWEIELIKPISEMVTYLESDEDLKNGYHLADMLCSTCFVSGSQSVYDSFKRQVNEVTLNEEMMLRRRKLVENDLEKYNTFYLNFFYRISTNRKLNVKHVFYRTVGLLIVALGKKYLIRSTSSFEIIRKLPPKAFPTHTLNNFKFCVALACAIRLLVYFESKQQNDDSIQDGVLMIIGKKNIAKFSKIVAELQTTVSDILEIRTLSKAFPRIFRKCMEALAGFSRSSPLKDHTFPLLNRKSDKFGRVLCSMNYDAHKFCGKISAGKAVDACFINSLLLGALGWPYNQQQNLWTTEIILDAAVCHAVAKDISVSKRLLNLLTSKEKNYELSSKVCNTYKAIGIFAYQWGYFEEALDFFAKEIEIRESFQVADSPEICDSYLNLAHCHYDLGAHKKARSCFEKSYNGRLGEPCQHMKICDSTINRGYLLSGIYHVVNYMTNKFKRTLRSSHKMKLSLIATLLFLCSLLYPEPNVVLTLTFLAAFYITDAACRLELPLISLILRICFYFNVITSVNHQFLLCRIVLISWWCSVYIRFGFDPYLSEVRYFAWCSSCNIFFVSSIIWLVVTQASAFPVLYDVYSFFKFMFSEFDLSHALACCQQQQVPDF